MRKSVYAIFFAVLLLAFSCDSIEGDFDESLPDFYTLTTTVSPEEGGTIEPSGGEFLAESSRQIVARPAEGYVFDNWSGDLAGNTNPTSIQFNTNRSVTAHFSLREYNLNLEIVGNGTVSETIVDQSSSFTVRLEAEAEEGWLFDRWEGDLTGSSNPETITIEGSEEKSVTAVFEQVLPEEYTIDISTKGSGTVEKDPDSQTYTEGEEISLTANAASGWKFIEWQGDLSGSSNPKTIVADEDKEITAVFEQNVPGEFTITTATEGSGSVEKDPDKEIYTEGEEVTLTANADPGWTFIEWQGDLSGSSNPETISADENKQITAVFEPAEPEEYTIDISTEGSGTVEKDPDRQSYTEGEEVILTANAAIGWKFMEWQGDLSGSSNPETIVADEDKQITAVFEIDDDFGITVNEVKLFIREMKLEGARNTRDFNTRDFILNVPTDGSPFEITHVDIPRGFYDELELDIKKPESKVELNDPEFRDGSGSYSLVVKGTFNGVDFTYRSDKDFEFEADINPHLEIRSGQTSVIALTMDFEGWFKGDNDGFLDPNDSRNTKQINDNIKDSFSDFEDEF